MRGRGQMHVDRVLDKNHLLAAHVMLCRFYWVSNVNISPNPKAPSCRHRAPFPKLPYRITLREKFALQITCLFFFLFSFQSPPLLHKWNERKTKKGKIKCLYACIICDVSCIIARATATSPTPKWEKSEILEHLFCSST